MAFRKILEVSVGDARGDVCIEFVGEGKELDTRGCYELLKMVVKAMAEQCKTSVVKLNALHLVTIATPVLVPTKERPS